MAIEKDPLKVENMTKTPKKNFSSLKDSAMKAVADAKNGVMSTKNKVSGAKSKLNKPKISAIDNSKSGKGIFTDILCCSLPSKLLREDLYKEALNRGVNKSYENEISACDLAKSKNPLDFAMKVGGIVRNYPGLLNGSMEDRLKYLAKSDLLSKLNIFGLGGLVPTCILGKTIDDMAFSSGPIGSTVHEKNELRNIMEQNPCTAMLANQPLISGWLSNSVSANLINVLIDSKKNGFNLYRFLDAALLITDQRASVIGGLISSIAFAKDYNTSMKTNAVAHLAQNGNLTPNELGMLKYPVKDLLIKLDKEVDEKGTIDSNPKQQFNNYTATFGVLDPNWKVWDAKGNKLMCDLSNKVLRSKECKDLELTNIVTTELKVEHKIAMACRFTHINHKPEHSTNVA